MNLMKLFYAKTNFIYMFITSGGFGSQFFVVDQIDETNEQIDAYYLAISTDYLRRTHSVRRSVSCGTFLLCAHTRPIKCINVLIYKLEKN